MKNTWHKIDISEEYTRSYDIRYIAEIQHTGLKTYRIIKDTDKAFLTNKINAQLTKWDHVWKTSTTKTQAAVQKELNQNLADERSKDAKDALLEIDRLLIHTLSIDDRVNWDLLKNTSEFGIPNPKVNLQGELAKIKDPEIPKLAELPKEPNKASFEPKLSFFDKIIKSSGRRKKENANHLYNLEMELWKSSVQAVEETNQKLIADHQLQLEIKKQERQKVESKYHDLEKAWETDMDEYYATQLSNNLKVEKLKSDYLQSDAIAVVEYCELVLSNSQYPDSFPKSFDLEYNSENKFLIVDFVLPAPEHLPSLCEVKYIAAKKELKEYYLSETQLAKTYDVTVYNITLRTIHEIFEADTIGAVETIVFNGWVETVNKATGKNTNSCIVSIQVKKDEFLEIDLANVDPRLCFKNLKGVGSSKLSGITAVQPIVQVAKNDKRFVSSYDVAHHLDDSYNLAAMNWEDFEHLIREVFGKEFSSNGGEVQVTQASRDGGVDAVAFDPDPIRGGKIVIQAKRYTNTVGVSAIRDLYGTVLNEGATKGILVTTSDYGPDAYDFAKNKPLTLLSGSNLLYLLEKHGHKARIDLLEAKLLQKDKL